MSYAVKEIFLTLQGEGGQAGRAAVFCRFAGCNLWSGREEDRATAACNFCDTDFVGMDGPGGGRFASADVLADAILAAWRGGAEDRLVVLTGGEPLLQVDPALVDALPARDRLDLRQSQGPGPGGSEGGTGAEAGLSPARRRSSRLRGLGLRALPAPAHGQSRPGREHPGGDRLLPFAPALASKRPDSQDSRYPLTGSPAFPT